MKKTYALINILLVILVIAANTYSSVNGINGNTVGGISDKYNTLFAPAGYAFSIWGIIYIGLIVFSIYQFKKVFFDKKEDEFVLKIGPWLSIANLANIIWLWAWLNEYLGLSLILMLIILSSLILIILKLKMELGASTFPIRTWVHLPISLYSGWITVATIANVSALLVSIEWLAIFDSTTWTVIMIIVATILNLLIIQTRKMRVFAAVGVWALLAIALRHWDSIAIIQWIAILSVIILIIAISYNGYMNRGSGWIVKYREYYKS